MLDFPEILKNNPTYLSEFVGYQENTYKGALEKQVILEGSSSSHVYSDGLYYTDDDIDVLLERTDSRIRGGKKIIFDMEHNPTKASTYKMYLLSALASEEHWYRTETDTDASGLEIKNYLNKIRHLVESNSPSPDDASWNGIRKNFPSLMHDIVECVENAKNKTDFLLDVCLSSNSKDYWIQCRILELYDTIVFKNDLDPYSEPNSPMTPLHPTDTFVKFKVDPSDFQEKKRNKFLLLTKMGEIRTEARLYTDFFNAKMALKNKNKNKI
jgi:hypothetical protein